MASQPFPIVVKVWAGEERHDFVYIRHSLKSLLASKLPPEARVILIDDHSTDTRVIPFLQKLAADCGNIEIWRNSRRMGPDGSQAENFAKVAKQFPKASFYILTDDDVVYHQDWLVRLIDVYHEATQKGLRGIFAALNVPALPHYTEMQLSVSKVLLKTRQPALNWLVPAKLYEEIGAFRDVGVAYDTDYTGRLAARGVPVVCLAPSYVQNIGFRGHYQKDETITARDYVGSRSSLMRAQDCWFAWRRNVLRAADRIPEGRFKEMLKRTGLPLRRLFRV